MELTRHEISVLQDQDFLLAKRDITLKIIHHLSTAESALKKWLGEIEFLFPDDIFVKAGKISRGESYRDLPYFVLDYPRLFSKKSVFAYRVMIWWGNEISFTLHLEGNALDQYRNFLLENVSTLENYYLCVHSTPWEYHFGPDNYVSISAMGEEYLHDSIQSEFVKISQKAGLDQLPHLDDLSVAHLKTLLSTLN